MKILKRFICVIVIAILALTFVGCGEKQKTQLATPQNVTCSDTGLITWDPVENADYYVVVLNGQNLKSETTSYQVGSVVNDFTYAVIALAERGYRMSEPSETKTFTGKGITPSVNPLIENLTVSITGNQLVGSGKSTKLTATVNFPDGNTNREVTWSVVDGGEWGSVDGSGKFTAKEVEEDHDVTVRATSIQNTEKYAEIVIGVACQPVLTAEMLESVKDNYISFDGYMDIDLYTFGLFETYVMTTQLYGISTRMDGERWHASYIDSAGYTANIDYRNIDGYSQQVALSLLNDEEYYPMTDEAGNPVRWEDAGLYNNFPKLKLNDFVFDETDWRYYYTGTDTDVIQKMVTSASPYEFEVSRLGLIIDDGEFLGIYAESKPTYTVASGYKAIEKLYSYINCGEENVTVPTIEKFAHNPVTTGGGRIDHDALGEAISNMQSLKSYKMDFMLSTHMAAGYGISGYIETVVEGNYYFEPYTVNTATYLRTMTPDEQYGYHKLSDELYNSYTYYADGDKYMAARAFDGDMVNAKASFAFAPEIFTTWGEYVDGDDNSNDYKIYFVDESMCLVASTLYYGVGNDMPLYGLFAMEYPYLSLSTPYVVVQNGYIVEAYFFYFLGDMYGEVVISYSDFNTAELPEEVAEYDWENDFVPRTPPTSWTQLFVIDETLNGEGNEVPALEYFARLLGSEEAANNVPFFNEILGDTFGFALATYRMLDYSMKNVETVILYYDVPLEADRSIDRTIKKTQEFLVQNGFEKNSRGEYVKGNISAMPYDSSLDFWIYVWKTV